VTGLPQGKEIRKCAAINGGWLDLKLSSYAAGTPMASTLLTLKAEEKIPNTLGLVTFERPSACLFYYKRPGEGTRPEFLPAERYRDSAADTGVLPTGPTRGPDRIHLGFNRKQVPGFPETIAEAYRFLIGLRPRPSPSASGSRLVYRP